MGAFFYLSMFLGFYRILQLYVNHLASDGLRFNAFKYPLVWYIFRIIEKV